MQYTILLVMAYAGLSINVFYNSVFGLVFLGFKNKLMAKEIIVQLNCFVKVKIFSRLFNFNDY